MKLPVEEISEHEDIVIVAESSIQQEEDKPFESDFHEVKMPAHEVHELESRFKDMRGLHEMKLKDKAFVFMVICVVILLIFYAIDLMIVNFNLTNSNFSSGIVELIKFIISALVGFLFSAKVHD